ncbi:DNA excision repair protein ERCC-1 [Porphyridium purpureum]|uniref:DNA excision repair protein ERCC-1 n=1 Tax=Porphyridium purpureum TaxID=35688 RepID=A0A5J4Z251_PORPP|nr:DNA excision repair protein ERCC-1 [Porphyridium purpureum]|eukprot:POR1332..scf208_2
MQARADSRREERDVGAETSDAGARAAAGHGGAQVGGKSFAESFEFLRGTDTYVAAERESLEQQVQENVDGNGSAVKEGASASGMSHGELALVEAKAARDKAKTALVIHPAQRRNPVLKWVRHVLKQVMPGFEADFLCGAHSCVFFLSLQFHLLNKGYIYERLKKLAPTDYKLRVLLVLADIPDPVQSLTELTKLCILANLTLICASTYGEAARYLETFRALDEKNPTAIIPHSEPDYLSTLSAALTSVRPVNKSNALMLASRFGTLAAIVKASERDLRSQPGMGAVKAKRLFEAFNAPLKKRQAKSVGKAHSVAK